LHNYDTNLKVNPPLRTKKDRDALRKALQNGVIDFIASHHQPENPDNKVCEFDHAKNGMETLESVFGAACVCGLSAEEFVKMQTRNIREIFKIDLLSLSKGSKANLTMFLPGAAFVFEEKDVFSKSKNNAFTGKKLKGKVIGIINGDKLFLK
jgi:dihydroorotase